MISHEFEDWMITIGVIIICILVMIIPIAAGIRYAQVKRACLALGYPDAQMDWTFEAYCTKRVDQTDVVVPLKEVLRGNQTSLSR